MSQKAVIITILLGLLALLLLLAVGNSSYLSTKASGSADDCRTLCQESCQGFATAQQTELCRNECQALCAESY